MIKAVMYTRYRPVPVINKEKRSHTICIDRITLVIELVVLELNVILKLIIY